MPDPIKLSEANRVKLDGIVQKMVANNEPEENIKFVVEDFKSKYAEKKNSNSTSENTNSVSGTKTTSSASSKNKDNYLYERLGEEYMEANKDKPYTPAKPLNKNKPNTFQKTNAPFNNSQFQLPQQQTQTADVIYDRFQKETSITPDEKARVKADLDAEINNEGAWNNVVNLAKDWWNGVFSQEPGVQADKNPLIDNMKSIKKDPKHKGITDTEATKLAYEMEISKRENTVKESKARDFLADAQNTKTPDGLSYKDKLETLQKTKLKKIEPELTTLESKHRIFEDKVQSMYSRLDELQSLFENNRKEGIESSNELIEEYNSIISNGKNIIKEADDNFKLLEKLSEEKGNFLYNLDLMKRDYGKWSNFSGRLQNSALRITSGIVGAFDYGLNMSDKITGNNQPIKQLTKLVSKEIDNKVNSDSEKLIKPIRVDDIESASDIGRWFFYNVAAEQAPILATTMIPYVGVGLVGASSMGQKHTEMQTEIANGAKYSDTEQALVPLAYGAAETVGAYVDRRMIGRAGSVYKSASASERSMISNGMAKEFLKSAGKSMAQEGIEEPATQLFQNVLDKSVLGKDVNVLDGVKDAFASSIMLTGAMNTPGGLRLIVNNAIKPFTYDSKMQNISKEILEFEKILDNKNLTDSERSIISEKLEKAKTVSQELLKNKIKEIGNLSNEEFSEVLRLEKAQANIRSKVLEIRKSENLTQEEKTRIEKALEVEFKANDNRRVELLKLAKDSGRTRDSIETESTEVTTTNETIETTEPEISETTKTETENTEEISEVYNPEGNLEPLEDLEVEEVNLGASSSIIDKIKNVFSKSLNVKNKLIKESIKKVSKSEVEKLKNEIGIEISEEYNHTIDSFAVNHIIKKHGNQSKEEKRGRIAITELDFTLIPDIIENYDTIEKGDLNKIGRETIKYTKTFEDGTTYVVEEVRTGKKELALNTMYKRKTGGYMPINENILPSTSETIPVDTNLNKNNDFSIKENELKENELVKENLNKKSLLTRVYKGESSNDLKDIIEKHGLDYKVENQKEAQNRAKTFVKEAGIDNSLKAVRENKIKGAEKAFVYSEILDELVELSENSSIDEISKIQEDYHVILEESLLAFDNEARDAGRFISALNKVYNTSKIRYSLTKQIADYKAINNGIIDEETLVKFQEADFKLKEIEEKIKEAEEKLLEQEQKLAIRNIEESISRENLNKASTKIKAKKLASEIRKIKIHKPNTFSSGNVATVVWDGAIETIATTIEAGGTFIDALQQGIEHIKSSNWYKNLSKDKQNEVIDSFKDTITKNSPSLNLTVEISEDGKIKIPENIIREYVKSGITDIDEISKRIIEDFFHETTDLTLREVRDSITKYGKTINPNKDEITSKVSELKRIGRLISAMEDVLSGKRPKKSGYQRDKPTQLEREMMREIKDKMRDLPIDEVDLEKQWKNALDATKSRLQNHIEDLEKQILNKEKSKIKRESVKLDDEAKKLKDKRDLLKKTLEELVGKPELTNEQKIIRAERQLESSIDKLSKQIANEQFEFKNKPAPVISERIKELRKQKTDLNEYIKKIREESGIIQKKRLQQAKSRLQNQILEFERKLKEKDYSKNKSNSLEVDKELHDLKIEQLKWREVFEKAKYEAELQNRQIKDYVKELFLGMVNIPRIIMAGGEMSMVLIQGGIQTASLAIRNPKKMANIFKKAFIAVGSNKKFEDYQRETKSDPYYALMKNTKLALTEADYKMELREEAFIGNNLVNGLWNLIGKGIEYTSLKTIGKKDSLTLGDSVISLIRKDLKTNKILISEQWKNINPLLAFERGNSIYMNELRKARFMDGVNMLKLEGKNENDNIEDFKKLASAINTMTGRANIGRLEGINDLLGVIFFSFKNTVSVFNQLNPYFYFSLHSSNEAWNKPSVAQKIAIKDMMTFVVTTTSMMFLLKAALGDDDEGNSNINIETDPRSSDFMQIKIKGRIKGISKEEQNDIRFDPWHGMRPQVVFFARLLSGEQSKGGKTKQIGEGYKADTHWDNFAKTYIYNKFSPSMQIVYAQMASNIDSEGNKKFYNKTFTERTDVYPMYIKSLQEIEKENPELYTRFLGALGFFGLNSSVY